MRFIEKKFIFIKKRSEYIIEVRILYRVVMYDTCCLFKSFAKQRTMRKFLKIIYIFQLGNDNSLAVRDLIFYYFQVRQFFKYDPNFVYSCRLYPLILIFHNNRVSSIIFARKEKRNLKKQSMSYSNLCIQMSFCFQILIGNTLIFLIVIKNEVGDSTINGFINIQSSF